jgi:hypothetical protein
VGGEEVSVIRFGQTNARGEPSRPRVDLNALGELLDRAALGVEMLRLRLRAAGEVPGTQAEKLERDLITTLREVRSVRARSRRRVPCDRIRE